MSIASVLNAKARPLSVWLTDAVVLAYALWTATCHAVMLAHGNVHHLAWTVACVFGAALLGLAVLVARHVRRKSGPGDPAASALVTPPPEPALPDAAGFDVRTSIVLAVLASAVIGFWLVSADALWFWAACVVYLAVAAVLCLRGEPERGGPAQPLRWQEAALWLMGLCCVFLALYAHRWRNDDCYYINLAVTMVDRPDAPLLSINTIHAPIPGQPGSDATFFPYRVHSFEALGGFIAYLTGLEPISVIHLGLGGGFALLVPFALAHLFQLLDRQRWFFMVVAAMCLLLFDGTSGLNFANQGIVRMFTGKSVLLTVALPVLVRHGIGFGLRPSPRNFVLLLASQITAVGLSSTALWLSPVAAMLAVMVPLRFQREALRPLLLGLLSCAYVLGIALWVRAHMGGYTTSGGEEEAAGVAMGADGKELFRVRLGLIWYWLRRIFQAPHVVQAYLGILLLAIPLCRTSLARRYLVAFTFMLALVFLNPYLGEVLRLKVLGKATGQRGIWLAPLPGAIAVVATCLIPSASRWWKRGLGVAAGGLLLFVFFTRVPVHGVFSSSNDVALRWPPGLRVPGAAFTMGRKLSAMLPRGAVVLAPEIVSWYLPTLRNHAFPLLANPKYLSTTEYEEHARERMVRWVNKRSAHFGKKEQDRFVALLQHYRLNAVVLNHDALKTHGLTSVLDQAGYRRARTIVKNYQLWLPKKRRPAR